MAKPIRISGVLLYSLFALSFDVTNCEILMAIHKVTPQVTERECD